MTKGYRVDKIYFLDSDDVSLYGTKFLETKNEDSWLWHRRLEHIQFNLMDKISSKDLVVGLPKIKFSKYKLFDTFQMGKKTRVSFKSKKYCFNFKISRASPPRFIWPL